MEGEYIWKLQRAKKEKVVFEAWRVEYREDIRSSLLVGHDIGCVVDSAH